MMKKISMDLDETFQLCSTRHYGPYAIQSRDTYLELEPSLSLT